MLSAVPAFTCLAGQLWEAGFQGGWKDPARVPVPVRSLPVRGCDQLMGWDITPGFAGNGIKAPHQVTYELIKGSASWVSLT